MKRILITVLLTLIYLSSYACHNSSFSIVSQTTNADGSITYVLNLDIDIGSFDSFYGVALVFNSSQNTPVVMPGGFDPLITNADLTSGTTDPLTGLIGADVNSVVGDGDWAQYDNRTDVLSYEWGGIFTAASSDLILTTSVTVMGCVESISFDGGVNAASAQCISTLNTGQNCALCSITALGLGTQTVCDPVTNTYTQEIVVTYTNEPTTGTLDVNGQSFAITSSPQTVTLTGLLADGNPVNTTAVFSDDAPCTMTTNNLFTAPLCTSCAANAGTISN